MPGRSTKQAPPMAISNPLSKAEKILGTGEAGFGSPTRMGDNGRSWETGSNSGISISISESSASQSGILDEDEDHLAGTNYGRSMWEEESEVLPRQLRNAHSSRWKSLKTKRSAITLGGRSRDAGTDDSNSRRPQSSSTVYSHYESAKMPLSISQQTSSSAMAKGLPTKANALLDIDGALAGKGPQRKKPTKLDFSKLRLRNRRDHNVDVNGVAPVLGNNYVMRSPSVMSHTSHSMTSPTAASPISPGRTPRVSMGHQNQPTAGASTRLGRLKGTNDVSGLHQLYDHYEKMSFRQVTELKEEEEEEDDEEGREDEGHLILLPRTYQPSDPDLSRDDMATPLPHSMARDNNTRWNHSRNTSQTSRATASRAGTPSTLQIRPASRNDYPASISSRHTRTSKATPSIISTMGSDRQQQSVLSLTDSESDGEAVDSRPGSSLPSYDNSFRDDASVSSSQRQPVSKRLSASHSIGSNNSKGPSYAQLNDFLTIPQPSPKTKGNRTPSTNTLHSTNSSVSTATRTSLPSHQDPRASVSTTGTVGSVLSPVYSTHSVQEARTISYTPLASTAEAASTVSVDQVPSNLNQILSHQMRHRASQNSHASDQPTPPLSPKSAEFYTRQPESARQDSMVNNAGEPHNARLMAVTRQEEMLLAALRKKRARMRENIIAEIEESGRGHVPKGSINNNIECVQKAAPINLKGTEKKEARETRAKAKQAKTVPGRSSSLIGRTNQKSSSGQSRLRDHSNGPRGVDVPPSTSHSAPIASNVLRISPEPESRPTGKARKERILLYLDQPIDSIDVIDQAEPSPDLSEFMDEELEFPMPGRGRPGSKVGSSPHASLYSSNHEARGRPRPDSSPVSPKSVPPKRGRHVQNLPKAKPEVNEDIDADDVDLDDLEEVVDRRRAPARRPAPLKEVARPDSPVSPANGFLAAPAPGGGHKKGKKSAVRLSAVGRVSSPIPWWGDDD
ncbi:hypothetical protein AAE478_007328 [Parahypoxylon ruwenzoriense]